MNALNAGGIAAVLTLDTSGFENGLTNALTAMDNFSNGKGNILGALGEIGTALEDMGEYLTKTLTNGIVQFYAAATGEYSGFEASMLKVKAVMAGISDEEYEALTDKAKELGASTEWSASDVADAFYYMGLAGWSAEESMEAIGSVLNLATAGGLSLGRACDIVTDGMTAMGVGAEDTTSFVDAMVQAANNSNTTIDQLGEAFKYAAPLAGTMGYGIGDLVTALGLMANMGIKGSQAGTAMRRFISNIAAPSGDDVTAALEAMGLVTRDEYNNVVALTDEYGNLVELSELLTIMRQNLEGISADDQLGLISAAFGTYALSGVAAITGASVEDWEALTTAIQNCEGAAASAAETMRSGFGAQVTTLKSAWEGVLIAFGESSAETLSPVLTTITNFLTDIAGMDQSDIDLITSAATALAAIGPVTWLSGKFMKIIADPKKLAIMAVAAGITAMVAAAVYLNEHTGELGLQNALKEMDELIDTTTSNQVVSGIKSDIDEAVADLTTSTSAYVTAEQALQSAASGLLTGVSDAAESSVNDHLASLTTLSGAVAAVLEQIDAANDEILTRGERSYALTASGATSDASTMGEAYSWVLADAETRTAQAWTDYRAAVEEAQSSGDIEGMAAAEQAALDEYNRTIAQIEQERVDRLNMMLEGIESSYMRTQGDSTAYVNEIAEDLTLYRDMQALQEALSAEGAVDDLASVMAGASSAVVQYFNEHSDDILGALASQLMLDPSELDFGAAMRGEYGAPEMIEVLNNLLSEYYSDIVSSARNADTAIGSSGYYSVLASLMGQGMGNYLGVANTQEGILSLIAGTTGTSVVSGLAEGIAAADDGSATDALAATIDTAELTTAAYNAGVLSIQAYQAGMAAGATGYTAGTGVSMASNVYINNATLTTPETVGGLARDVGLSVSSIISGRGIY